MVGWAIGPLWQLWRLPTLHLHTYLPRKPSRCVARKLSASCWL